MNEEIDTGNQTNPETAADDIEEIQFTSRGAEELNTLLESEEFRDNYAHVETSNERQALEALEAGASKKAEKQLKELISQTAAEMLGTTVEDGRRLGKDWGMALRGVTEVIYGDETYSVEQGKCEELLIKLAEGFRAETDFQGELGSLEENYTLKHSEATEHISHIQSQLAELKTDPNLFQAFEAWGVSPDENDDRGKDGNGHHAGVVHYFQYRGNEEKAGRFSRDEVEFGLEGFKQKTLEYQALVEDPAHESIVASTLFSDENGAKRLVVMNEMNEIIVAFAQPEEELKIISVFSQKNEKGAMKQYESITSRELAMEADSDTRLNKLGLERTLEWSHSHQE